MPSISKTTPLTRHNYSIIELVAEGMTNKMIADEMGTTERGVKSSLLRTYGKLSVRNRVQLIYYWNCELFHVDLKELGRV